MTNTDVVRKLIGNITPVGETNTDNERFENLKNMIVLVEHLLLDIDEVGYKFKDSHEFSVKRASDFSRDFINKITKLFYLENCHF